MPTGLLDLNDDVFERIVFYLDSADARRLSRTARSIHAIADHHALQCVALRSLVNLTKFCTYMLTKRRHRLLSLRELRIHCLCFVPLAWTGYQMHVSDHTGYERGARLMADLIQEAKRLQVLCLSSAEYWLQQEPRLGDALSSLRHLLEIELQNLGPKISRSILEMQSTPRKLIFSSPSFHDGRGLLPRYPSQGKLVLDPKRRMPSVQYLSVTDGTNLPDTITLTRVFPALRSFEITSGGHVRSSAATDPDHIVNWPLLERVRGPSYLLSRWKNATAVHLLHLTDHLRFHEPHTSARPMPVARNWDLSPVRVLSSFQPVAFIAQLDSRVPTPLWHQLLDYTSSFGSLGGSARLRYLSIELNDIDTREAVGVGLDRWWVSVPVQIPME